MCRWSALQILTIKPVINKTYRSNQQFTLQLICKPGAVVDHVGGDDTSIGESGVKRGLRLSQGQWWAMWVTRTLS